MKKLPIGTQDFATLRLDGCVYVDKTAAIHRMLDEGRVYFLARPRRFGKSLLVSTLKAVFEGRRNLFKGLAIERLACDWKPHPVLHLDLGAQHFRDAAALRAWLQDRIQRFCATHAVSASGIGGEGLFSNALEVLAARGQRTAVLIDEYDKPILDHIEDTPMAAEMRDSLKSFYGSLKSNDPYLRFVFLTGVSKFAKMNVFSGLNNLQDITIDRRFATLLGYTQTELESNFDDRIAALAAAKRLDREACLAKIRDWYNGYRFHTVAERVYNPFSTLLLFQKREFANYWYETGTPTFLLKLIQCHEAPAVADLDGINVGAAAFSSYEPERLTPLPLLFQTGYLTILSYDSGSGLFRLGYPNREVRGAFVESLLSAFSTVENGLEAAYVERLKQALRAGDIERFFQTMSVFFANIPYDIQIRAEKY